MISEIRDSRRLPQTRKTDLHRMNEMNGAHRNSNADTHVDTFTGVGEL